MLAVESVRG